MVSLTEQAPGHWHLTGAVTLATVPALARETARIIRPHTTVQIDLAAAGPTSSAALALFLEWRAYALRVDCRLEYLNWPETLRRLAALSNLTELLLMPSSAPLRADGEDIRCSPATD